MAPTSPQKGNGEVEVPVGSPLDEAAKIHVRGKDDGEVAFASEGVSSLPEAHMVEGSGSVDEEREEGAPPQARTLSTVDEKFLSSCSSLAVPSARKLPSASWLRQLKCVLWKNLLQLSRRPVTLFLMLFSSIASVILAWAAGKDSSYPLPPLTECGTIPLDLLGNDTWIKENYVYASNIPSTLNESWRGGLAATVMALGPMVQAICAFLVVHSEMQSKMLGVLRGLGLRDSVYWLAWLVPFVASSFVNSLLGAATASVLPVHVFQSTYYGGVFASLFFLQVALVPASFFLAAVCGSSRGGAPWLVLVMLLAAFVPFMVASLSSQYVYPYIDVKSLAPNGMFWYYQSTTQLIWNPNTQLNDLKCNKPILSQEYGTRYKNHLEQQILSKSDYFVGCFANSGYFSYTYNNPNGIGGLVPLFMFPYFHFLSMWSNFLGYTAMEGRIFKNAQASMSAERLAVASLPSPPDPTRGNGTTLYPQGSTLNLWSYYEQAQYYCDADGQCYYTDACPAPNAMEGSDFCPYLSNCNHGSEPSPTHGTPSSNDSIAILVLLATIYYLLASYWAQVFSCGNGAPRKWYFFVTMRYWFGESWTGSGGDGRSDGGAEARRSSVSSGGGVVMDEVRKRFGDFEAVRGVTMRMRRGEVTALLGHNGAGKTTLSNILTCEILPTEGDVYVFGASVKWDQYAVRSMVGVCRQDDYLWDDMSAREHLELFAGLRGVDPKRLPDTVQRWLESVDLAEVQLGYSSSFSGGMKRRLSVALATIGDRPLIVLDEPTTGMDPVSRRFIWRHIEKIKDDCVVLLTTHAMEEADLLADMVAIMRKGDLAVFGSPLQLKAEHGSALQFTLLVDKACVEDAEEAIRSRFSDRPEFVTVDAGEAGNITVNIQCIRQNLDEGGVPVEDFSDFVEWLDDPGSGGVLEYGFSNSSLEEVFLEVTKESKGGGNDQADNENDVDVCCDCCCLSCIACCLKGCCRCCCRPKPRIEEAAGEATNGEVGADCADGNAADVLGSMSSATFKPTLSITLQVRAILIFSFTHHWTGKSSIANYVMFSILVIMSTIVGLMADATRDTYPVFAMFVAFLTFMLMSIIGPIYTDRAEGLFYLQRTQGMLPQSYLLGTGLYAFLVQLAYGFVLLSLLYATPLFREPTLCTDKYYCSQSAAEPPIYSPLPVYFYQHGENKIYAAPAAGSYGKIFGIVILFALAMPGAALSSSYLPGKKFAIILMVFVLLLACIAPLWLYFAFMLSEENTTECADFLGHGSDVICGQTFTMDTLGTDFLDCVGVYISNSVPALCIPPSASIVSQFGAYQSLSLTLHSDIKFWSKPASYVEEVLIPNMSGADCSGTRCKFPLAQSLYGKTLGFWFLGAILTLVLGIALSFVFGKFHQSLS